MRKCLLTYNPCATDYSKEGLRSLSPKLTTLHPMPFTAEELRLEASQRAGRMSIQGVQAKLSAILEPSKNQLSLVDAGGRYILKPQSALFSELPQNEDLTMHLARLVGIETPVHGLVYSKDQSLNYFIKRFDRHGHSSKWAVEDFAQLAQMTRDTKYDFSMEKLVGILDLCTFPLIERQKLLTRVIFNYLIGNEDMHLKNYSLITRNKLVELAPAYDFLNSSIVLKNPVEIALPIAGRQKNLTRENLLNYFARERMLLNQKAVDDVMSRFQGVIPQWKVWIEKSFLSAPLRASYKDLLEKRSEALGL
ncbi:MAG: HipA domain-containing protein [Pseudomonadota bacterium]